MIQDATTTAFKTHACVEIRCNVCGYVHDEDDDGIRHFTDRNQAIEQAGYYGWTSTANTIADRQSGTAFDGYAICSTEDAVHDAARHWLSTKGLGPVATENVASDGYAIEAVAR